MSNLKLRKIWNFGQSVSNCRSHIVVDLPINLLEIEKSFDPILRDFEMMRDAPIQVAKRVLFF
jgi:hypothetical protein